MNPELPRNPREEMELRLTALLLGELSADEAAAVREAIAKDPELSKLHDDLKQTIHLVREATTSRVKPYPSGPNFLWAEGKEFWVYFQIGSPQNTPGKNGR